MLLLSFHCLNSIHLVVLKPTAYCICTLTETKQNTSRYDLTYCESKLFLIVFATEGTGRNDINVNKDRAEQ